MTVDVAIVGGGPAGVAAALELRHHGHSVIILEREACLGGATRHCSHSPFGMREFGRIYLGAAYGQRLQNDAARAGVDLRYHQSVTRIGPGGQLEIANPDGLTSLTARRILIATGAREKPRSARMLPGDRPVGVITTGTLQAMIAFQHKIPFRRPLILGSELVTLSAVMTCRSNGIYPVAVIETRPFPLVCAPLSWFPGLLGIPFHTGTQVLDIIGKGRVEAVRILRAGQEQVIACDGLLLTGHFTPEASLLQMSGLALCPDTAGPVIDQTGRLAAGLYAAGNLLRPVETCGWAYREGRCIGQTIAADLQRGTATATVRVTHDAPLRYVVPQFLQRGMAGMQHFQLRVTRPVVGEIALELDGRAVFRLQNRWMPERRILVPIPKQAMQAAHVHFSFRESD
ncbi:MAG: FAD-dependent oxidoreductase [Pseudotabrizicola sp.]|uniref:NAD(P)/FAD-dependent oxidoreductase n=1 Tax=Pseudotabrizicola sp. TaxID=2939647 RepID=UPI00271E3971|nr:FAD-dependent oxidoreductase [Pseudotabrizicola sp.]MDO9636990.1 FAD-dependent oxidoreductase [Pseudotabrizicola sp.]